MIPTTSTGWQPGNPVRLRLSLERSWGYSSTNGHKTAEFCPMCMAMVPYEDDHEPKRQHIGYHVALAESVQQQDKALVDGTLVTDDGR